MDDTNRQREKEIKKPWRERLLAPASKLSNVLRDKIWHPAAAVVQQLRREGSQAAENHNIIHNSARADAFLREDFGLLSFCLSVVTFAGRMQTQRLQVLPLARPKTAAATRAGRGLQMAAMNI